MKARSFFAVVDQVVVSSRNILFLLLSASLAEPAEFALLAVWLTVVQLASGLFSASIVDAWLVSGQASPDTRPGRRSATFAAAAALVVVLAIANPLLVASWGFLPLAFLLEERRASAHLAGSWWTVAMIAFLPMAGMLTGALLRPSALGLAGGMLVGMAIAGLPALIQPRRAVRTGRRMSGGFALDFLTSAGYGQVIVLVLAALLSPVDAGALRLGQQFFSLPAIALSGLRMVLLPEKRKSLSRRDYLRYLRCSAPASVTAAAVIWLVLAGVSARVVNPVGDVVREISLPLAIQSAVLGLYTLTPILLKRLGRAAALVRGRLVTVVLSAGSVGVGAVMAGVPGAAWGLACGSLMGLVVWHYVAWRHMPMAY